MGGRAVSAFAQGPESAINLGAMKLLFIALCAILGSVHAADFPSKPVRFVTGAAAGSTGDVLGRVLADQLATLWKQPTTVDNRPGGRGVIASQATLPPPPHPPTVCISPPSSLS